MYVVDLLFKARAGRVTGRVSPLIEHRGSSLSLSLSNCSPGVSSSHADDCGFAPASLVACRAVSLEDPDPAPTPGPVAPFAAARWPPARPRSAADDGAGDGGADESLASPMSASSAIIPHGK